jgi:hypothetical protein
MFDVAGHLTCSIASDNRANQLAAALRKYYDTLVCSRSWHASHI